MELGRTIKHYGWDEITQALLILRLRLENRKDIWKYKKIYALGRGGMVPARLLSGALGIKDVGFIEVGKYHLLEKKHVIICDDIFDTGKTYHDTIKLIGKEKKLFAFLYKRGELDHMNNMPEAQRIVYGKVVEDSRYIVFPWEDNEDD